MALIARDAALGPLTGQAGRAVRCHQILLDRHARDRNQCLHRQSHGAGEDRARPEEKELIVGDTGPGTGTHSYPKALNDILGFKFKLVGGYPSSADVFLAMERGEVQGICESLDSVKARQARLDFVGHGFRPVPGRRHGPIPN